MKKDDRNSSHYYCLVETKKYPDSIALPQEEGTDADANAAVIKSREVKKKFNILEAERSAKSIQLRENEEASPIAYKVEGDSNADLSFDEDELIKLPVTLLNPILGANCGE